MGCVLAIPALIPLGLAYSLVGKLGFKYGPMVRLLIFVVAIALSLAAVGYGYYITFQGMETDREWVPGKGYLVTYTTYPLPGWPIMIISGISAIALPFWGLFGSQEEWDKTMAESKNDQQVRREPRVGSSFERHGDGSHCDRCGYELIGPGGPCRKCDDVQTKPCSSCGRYILFNDKTCPYCGGDA